MKGASSNIYFFLFSSPNRGEGGTICVNFVGGLEERKGSGSNSECLIHYFLLRALEFAYKQIEIEL